MADCGENGVGGIALRSLQIAAVEMSFGLHVADNWLNGRTAPELALDDAEHAAFLSGQEDAMRVGRIVAAIVLVDVSSLDGAPGEAFGAFDACSRVWPSSGLPGNAAACSTNWPPGARALVVVIETLIRPVH